jgi:hypothetical protein
MGYEWPSGSNGYYLHPGPNLIVRAKVMDSKTLDDNYLVHTLPMDPLSLSTREEFMAEVLRCVCMVERHEAMEFLKASGVRVKNPHPSPYEVLYS